MKQLFAEVFEYHHQVNLKLIPELAKHQFSLPERTLPLFSHVLNAHQVWNSRILDHQSFGVWDVHPIGSFPDIENTNYHNTIKILNDVDFDKIIHYRTQKGINYSNSIRDILFHVNNHSTHHKGQIISDFRQHGINPLETDYIFYKR